MVVALRLVRQIELPRVEGRKNWPPTRGVVNRKSKKRKRGRMKKDPCLLEGRNDGRGRLQSYTN